ncbi:MAG TPA: YafY family protein, partial [Steroidobacteraceae bacterium]|nr:YafY family protein [Steroidobacteraceae bacterium]
LQSRRHWSGSALSARLEIDARTVRRDVDRLRELGYPIQASSGLGGGYQLGAGSSMPPVLFDDDEAVVVAMALRVAAGSVGKMEETAIALLAKLDQVLPARLRKRASALHSVTISLASAEAVPPVDVLTRIASACRDHMKLKLSYKDRDGKATARTLEPLRLAHTGRRWYLVAWDLQREDWRTFRVDRVERLGSAGPAFVPREFPGDIARYVTRSIAHSNYKYRVRVKLDGSAEMLSKQVPSWCGVLEAVDDKSCVLNTSADSFESLTALIAMTGVDFEILDAPELLPDLRRVVERLYRATRAPAS